MSSSPPRASLSWPLAFPRLLLPAAALLAWAACSATVAAADGDRERFFETEIRPLLAEHCTACHGAKKQESGLRLDSRAALLAGGDRGAAIAPGDASASLLLEAVRGEGDLVMPPDRKLTERQIAALVRWIELDAPWPASNPPLPEAPRPSAADHWAFQPIRQPDVPPVSDTAWPRSPLDRFVLARLEQAELSPAAEADRRTLVRRASYALTGLPPAPETVAAVAADADPLAYERFVDELLESPRYGEHWARHWLDVARYSDTKGYVYDREERFWVHAWAYRDWVATALNDDMPYDRFLLLQMAADQVDDRRPGDLAAMGFLTLGRRFLGVQRDIVDDRIDVVTRGALGLTVACARCHDHKYDPIPTADYYSLYGVFDSCRERQVALDPVAEHDEAFASELRARQAKLEQTLAARRAESSARARERLVDYLRAQTELERYPAQGFDQVFEKNDLLPAYVRRWETYLRQAKRQGDPIFAAWHAFAELDAEHFARDAVAVTQQLATADERAEPIHPLVAEAFTDPPANFDEVIQRYGALFADVEARWRKALDEAAQRGAEPPTELADQAEEQLRQVLYGPQAPCQAPDEPIVHIEGFFDTGTCTELWKLQGEVDRWIINSNPPAPFAVTLVDRTQPSEPRIFRRGNPLNQGDEVPRRFLSLLAGERAEPFQQGSGRLELARAIVEPGNPLTARVIVNRVWAHHFGRGLVDTPSDFGTRAAAPSHPELLDWLATRFTTDGWSLKRLHRIILTSATFRQASLPEGDPSRIARAQQLDPANRLLWRMPPRRLSFEEYRDSLLAVAGQLDRQIGGKSEPLFESPYSRRRTLYGRVDRQFLPGTLRMFDFANPDLHVPSRSETTVPQQALFLMNHPLMLERARALAAAVAGASEEAAVAALFQRSYQRRPTAAEMADALEFLHAASDAEPETRPATAADWQYGYGEYDDESGRLLDFTPLPHFTGSAWQGGPQWPDARLGWVQLTAEGGHPGDDRQHASVRRWTAPRAMTLDIRSRLTHEPAAGDGIRAHLVSSRGGTLKSATVHQQTVELNVSALEVEQGETLDFVVDIGKVLNSDQYLWTATISRHDAGGETPRWNSQGDFTATTAQRLSALEQLAQIMLCANEFLFID